MTKQQIIDTFDPSQPGQADQSLFGLPFSADQSQIIIIPVPWEVTVSYGSGASNGPKAILSASSQVDLHHQEYPELWKLGIHLVQNTQTKNWEKESKKLKKLAQPIIQALENGQDINQDKTLQTNQKTINDACQKLNQQVAEQTKNWLQKNKFVALLGGDHSTPLGYYQALATQHDDYGILHLDAHMDLRIAYEGFTYSHASVMYNALQIKQITKIVQVGIRDFCQQEAHTAQTNRIIVHTDTDQKAAQYSGTTWAQQCDNIIAQLPQKVEVSFDIDALQSWYCPNTGTPVPGGIAYEQATYLLSKLANSNKQIIGFDLVEVAPGTDDWDGNVGARLLYHLCGMLAKNNKCDVGQKIIFDAKPLG